MSSLLINLTALGGAPTVDDLLYIVDDPSGTPVDRKMTIAELFTSPTILTPSLVASDAVTNAPSIAATVAHWTSGVPVAGFGVEQLFQLEDAANVVVNAGSFVFEWVTPAAPYSTDFYLEFANGATPLWANSDATSVPRLDLGAAGGTPAGATVRVLGHSTIDAMSITNAAPTGFPLIIFGAPAQSENLTRWDSSAGVPQARITFDGGAVFNEAGTATGDVRIEGDTDANLFFTDASADRVGIGVAAPVSKLQVALPAVATGAGAYLTLSSATMTTFRGRLGGTGDNYSFMANVYYDGAAFQRDNVGLGAWWNRLLPGGSDAASRWDVAYFNVASAAFSVPLTVYGNGLVVINEDGVSTADVRIEGDTDVNLLFIDASADTVQVGAAVTADSAKFYVNGKLSTAGEAEINGNLNHDGTNVGFYAVAPVARATTGIAEAAFVENAGGVAVNDDSTFGGYTLQQVVQALQLIGILT